MNSLLNELLTRIKTNCESSNHNLTEDQIDDIRDVLAPFANRFDAMETFCEMMRDGSPTILETSQFNQLELVFPQV